MKVVSLLLEIVHESDISRLATSLSSVQSKVAKNSMRSSFVYIMASSSNVLRLSPANFTPNIYANGKSADDDSSNDSDSQDILPGAKLEDQRSFVDKKGTKLSLTPVIVDFRRLLQTKSSKEVIPGVPNGDLLHAVVGLYDVSLSEMTPDVLYTSACDKQARTIIFLRDIKDSILDLQTRHGVSEPNSPNDTTNDEVKSDTDIFHLEEDRPSTFADVFSDTDRESEKSEEEEDDDEDFSKGINSFLSTVRTRRRERRKSRSTIVDSNIGIENRIVGAATYEKAFCKPGERVIHLTLIAVRKRFRKWGIGKYLLSKIKDSSVVGPYDAVVVHADNSALDFFERYGFSDDIVLNSRWSDLAEQFTNCTLMSYIPPFTGQTITSASVPELDILAMEKEIKKWREKSLDAYRSEVGCMNRMRHEIIHLRALVSSQQELITTLATSNEKLRQEKFCIEKNFLEYKLQTAQTAFNEDQFDDEETEDATRQLIHDLEQEARRNVARSKFTSDGGHSRQFMVSQGERTHNGEPYDHGKDTEDFFRTSRDFYTGMKADSSVVTTYEVKIVSKAVPANSVSEAYKLRVAKLNDPSMVTRLYFCGTLERSSRINEILKKGFSENDFAHGDYGRGLYFSKYPSKAAQFSVLGKLIVVDVGLGKLSTVVKKQNTETSPPAGADSIITPGRLKPSNDDDNMLCQEYVVFDCNQTMPYALIEYSPVA